MQLGLILLLIEVALIVHAAKTGRFWPWGFIILSIPGFGALAYVLIDHLPMVRSPSHAPMFSML